ncbi:MAG: ATP-binding protein, partial [Acidimicrobiia bacterium]
AGDVGVALALLAVGLVVLVGSLAVAIGKYRLYDVDVVINRTVAFAVLAGFIALVYATVVIGVGSRIGAAGEGWAPILATAAVALAFEPVRHVAQRWANRLAYGHRATPYEVLSDVTGRLTGSAEPDRLLDRMADLVVDGTGAERATIWLGEPGGMRPVATSGPGSPPEADIDLSADTVFQVEHDGETVGALEVVAPRGGRLSTQERALLRDLAGSAGAVLGHQRLNESLAAKARELDRSRRRLVDAEDQELRRLERELDEGAQQQVLAIKVNLALVERAAAEQGAERLAALLAGLGEETQAALDEVRRLSKGIYPPVLQSDGLGAALSALAAGAPVPVEVHGDGVGRYPPEVEAAVYFDVAEAITNAVKHATPPIRVEVGEREGLLAFTVSDAGPGFDPAMVAAGSGLANLRDRVDAVGGRVWVRSAPGSGTTVAGEVSLDREPAVD